MVYVDTKYEDLRDFLISLIIFMVSFVAGVLSTIMMIETFTILLLITFLISGITTGIFWFVCWRCLDSLFYIILLERKNEREDRLNG